MRRTSLALIAVASSAALIAGCGSSSSGGGSGTNNSSQTPSAELTSAVNALGDASTLTASLKLDATASEINDLATSNGGSPLTSTQANAVAGAQVSIEVSAPSGKTISDLRTDNSGAAVDVTISDNGTNFVSLRVVNKTLYVQADLKDLLNAFGRGSTYAQLQGASGLPAFLTALIGGKWISLPESTLGSFTGSSGTNGAPTPQQQTAIINSLKNILSNDVTATRTSSGSTDTLALSANSRTVAKDFISTITSAVPSAGAALGSTDPNTIPSKNIALGAQVTGGALSQLSIDLGQFDPQGKGHLPVDLNFSQDGAQITAPSGAVAVNTQELAQLFGSFAGGLGASG